MQCHNIEFYPDFNTTDADTNIHKVHHQINECYVCSVDFLCDYHGNVSTLFYK